MSDEPRLIERRFIVTVTEVGLEKTIIGKTWTKGAGETPEAYGYTPETESTRTVENEPSPNPQHTDGR